MYAALRRKTKDTYPLPFTLKQLQKLAMTKKYFCIHPFMEQDVPLL